MGQAFPFPFLFSPGPECFRECYSSPSGSGQCPAFQAKNCWISRNAAASCTVIVCINCVTGQTKELGFRKARLSFPFPFFLLPFLLFISLCPEGLRMCYSSPSGSGQCPATKCFLVLFKLKIAEFQEMPYQLAAYCTVIVCRVFLIWWRRCLRPTLRCSVGILTGMTRFYVLSVPMGHSSVQYKV